MEGNIEKIKEYLSFDSLKITEYNKLIENDRGKIIATSNYQNSVVINKPPKTSYLLEGYVEDMEVKFYFQINTTLEEFVDELFIETDVYGSSNNLEQFANKTEYLVFIPNDISVSEKFYYTSPNWDYSVLICNDKQLKEIIQTELTNDDFSMLRDLVKMYGLDEYENGFLDREKLNAIKNEEADNEFNKIWDTDSTLFMKTYYNEDYEILLEKYGEKMNLSKIKDLYRAKFLKDHALYYFFENIADSNLFFNGEFYSKVINWKNWVDENLQSACEHVFGSIPKRTDGNRRYLVEVDLV